MVLHATAVVAIYVQTRVIHELTFAAALSISIVVPFVDVPVHAWLPDCRWFESWLRYAMRPLGARTVRMVASCGWGLWWCFLQPSWSGRSAQLQTPSCSSCDRHLLSVAVWGPVAVAAAGVAAAERVRARGIALDSVLLGPTSVTDPPTHLIAVSAPLVTCGSTAKCGGWAAPSFPGVLHQAMPAFRVWRDPRHRETNGQAPVLAPRRATMAPSR